MITKCVVAFGRVLISAAIASSLSSNPPQTLIALVQQVCEVVESSMDGTSGALYSIFLNALLQYFATHVEQCARAGEQDAAAWSNALTAAMEALSVYTPAQPGDRTLVDALAPFVSVLASSHDVQEAVSAALAGAESTKSMKSVLGRSVYVGNESSWMGQIPDPGAWGLSTLLKGMCTH